jgi:protein-serine/threonine kinase
MCQENLESRTYRSSIKHVLRIDTEEQRQLHQFNSFVGTPEYFAPEIITGFGYSSLVDYWALGILIFEMLFGYTPFRGENNNTTFDQILHGTYSIPESNCHGPISKSCRELIKKLVCADVHHRLGHKHGALDIKSHPFFRDIDFNNLANNPPPIQPHLCTKEVGQSVSIQDSQDSSGSGEIERLYSVDDNFDNLDHLGK